MLSFLARNRWVFVGLALLAAGFAEMAHGAGPSDKDVYSARLGVRYRIATVKSTSFMVLVHVDADSPLRALPVDLAKFDIVLAMDDMELASPGDVERHYAGTKVTLINSRAHDLRHYTIDLPPVAGQATAPRRMLGVYGENCVLPIAGNGGPAGYRGLAITSVVANSPAHRAGFGPGVMIGQVNDERIIDMDSLREAIARSGPVARVLLYRPDGSSRWVNVPLGP